jgi:hypothetical protein
VSKEESQRAESEESEERVAELEAEVSRLKGELAARSAAEARPASGEENLAPSRTKMILVAIGIAIVALAGFALVFSALSSGFDSLARKAAKTFAPDDPGAGSGSAAPAPAPREPAPPRAPGL